MAVKTFTQAEKLTAADTNTYLANGGLVYITQATFSASAELNLTSVFSATFDAYQLVFSNFTASLNCQLYLRMLSGATPLTTNNYLNQRLYVQGASVGGTSTGAIGNGNWGYMTTTYRTGATITIYNPFLAAATSMSHNLIYDVAYLELNNTVVTNTTSYDGIRVYPSTGNLTGTVRVYGLRQA
jgi:hypothetical protein